MPSTAATPANSLREKKRALYKEAILDASEKVFGDEGYDEAKVQRIAAESGVSLTTLYGVFESKWEIYRAVHRRRLAEIMPISAEVLQLGGTTAERLIEGMRLQLLFLMRYPDYLRMQLKEVSAWSTLELLKSPEQIDALGIGMELITQMFAQCIKEGVFIDDDPELMTKTTLASQQVRLALWMERGMKDEPSCVADAAIAQMLRSYRNETA